MSKPFLFYFYIVDREVSVSVSEIGVSGGKDMIGWMDKQPLTRSTKE